MALRYFLFLLAAYIVFHKIFPFGLFRTRLADMTGRRNRVYSTGAAPPRQALVRAVDRPRLWRDRDRGWIRVDFDIGKKGDYNNRGPLGRELHFVAAVLALRFLHPLEASLRFPHFLNQPDFGIEWAEGEGLVAGRVRCGVWRSKCTVSFRRRCTR